LAERVAIVTGASSGIGEATARELARRGFAVVLAARSADRLEAVKRAIEAQGGRALAVPTDIRLRADVDRLVAAAVATFGRIDVLVNNAGVSDRSTLLEGDDEVLRRLVEVNLLGPARCVQAAGPYLRRQGGVIVNVGSVVGEVAATGLYPATKFGLRGFTDSLRREMRDSRIAVVLVEPGFIRTPMTVGVRLPMPGPGIVARTIANAVEHPRRRVIVPWVYVPVVYASKLLPGLVDFLMLRVARRVVRRPGAR
jgi:NAD(P)-dependent dehydrogenase (short-subunit alcohol dehydrogenase family)